MTDSEDKNEANTKYFAALNEEADFLHAARELGFEPLRRIGLMIVSSKSRKPRYKKLISP